MSTIRILAINGSHRKGNTEFMLGIILDSAKGQGAETELINLREKNIDFCDSGNEFCGNSGKCCIEDDMINVCKKIEEAEILVLASPAYFSNVSARMKNFMDRCNPYWFNKKLKGKKVFLLGVGGSGDKSINEMLDIMKEFVRILGMGLIGTYYAKADKIGELKDNPKVIKELQGIGVKLGK